MAEYDVREAFEAIEDELISSMMRNFKRHRDWEKSEGFEWTQWQAMQLDGLKQFRLDNKKIFGNYFLKINDKIESMLRTAYTDGESDQEAQILEAIKRGYSPPQTPFMGEISGSASFFALNNRKLNALIQAVQLDMEKAETATLRKIEDEYRKIIYNAQVYMNTGAGTLDKAIDMATRDFLSSGINSIEYADGRRVGIDSYAEMALRTANKRAYLHGEASKRDEWGIHTVIVTKRGVACPRCLKYTGRVFIDDVWSAGKPNGRYPLLSSAIAGGLYHPNCKDSHTTYFEGVSTPPKPPSLAEKEDAERVYSLQQEQRYNERQIRKYKRLSQYSLDTDSKKADVQKLDYWKDRQVKFIGAHAELRRHPNRERVRLNSISADAINESGLTSVRSGTNKVDLAYIKSAEYRHKFNKMTNNSTVNDNIRTHSASLLTHCKDTDTEGLRIIDARSGKLLFEKYGKKDAMGIELNENDFGKIRNFSGNIIGIHNHPSNIPPTGSDFGAAGARKYVFGIVVTHDGRVFQYKPGNKPFVAMLFDSRVDKYRNPPYNMDVEKSFAAAIKDFGKEYGIICLEK